MTKIVELDSLIANEFELHIGDQIADGIFAVHNLITFQVNEQGERMKLPFEVSKMVQRDGNNPFNSWLRETRAADGDLPRRDVTVVAVDDGVITRRWRAKNAWIQKVSYSSFDTASFEMIAEVFTIGYDDMEEEWPATD